MRWHYTIDEALLELDHYNCWHADWDDIQNSEKIDSFWGDIDETSMSAGDGEFFCVLLCPSDFDSIHQHSLSFSVHIYLLQVLRS